MLLPPLLPCQPRRHKEAPRVDGRHGGEERAVEERQQHKRRGRPHAVKHRAAKLRQQQDAGAAGERVDAGDGALVWQMVVVVVVVVAVIVVVMMVNMLMLMMFFNIVYPYAAPFCVFPVFTVVRRVG